jgi:cyclohexyl-isocyanide hydratase
VPPRRIAFFVFPRLTVLDLVGAYDALRRVAAMGIDPGVSHRIAGTAPEIEDETGLVIRPDAVYPDLADFDLLYVPGGLGTRTLVEDPRAIDYLRAWGGERPLASVCTGALLLGKAGHLAGLRATTHHRALDALRPFCREVAADRRIVDEGRVVTAGGVASSLDLGLYLVEKYWGAPARERIAAQMEYRAYAPGTPIDAARATG